MRRFITSSLKAHRGRLFLTSIAIMLSVSFVTASFVLADSLRAVFGDVSSQIYEDVDAGISSAEGTFDQVASGERFSETALAPVAEIDGVADVVPSLGAEFALFTIDSAGETLRPQGPPVLAFSAASDPNVPGALSSASPFTQIDGTAPGPGEIMLDTAQAAVLEIGVGDQVMVATPNGPVPFTLSGTVVFGEEESGVSPYFLLFDLPTIQGLLDAPGMVDGAALLFHDGANPETVLADVQSALPDSLFVEDQAQLIADQNDVFGEFIDVIQIGLLAFAAITTFVAIFVIGNTFAVLVSQRLRQLGLLRAIGATNRQAGTAVVAEAALVGTLASATGIGLGVLVARGIVALFEAVTTGGFPEGPLEIAPRTVIVALLVGIGVTVLSAIIPARRAANVSPIQALQEAEPSAPARRSVLGVLLAIFGAPIARLFGTSGRLAAMNLQRNPRRVLSTAMSMIVGLALITGMSVMGASYKATLEEAMQSDFNADLVVTPVDGATIPFDALRAVADLPAVEAASGFGTTEVLFGGDVIDAASFQPGLANDVLDLGVVEGTITGFGAENSAISADFADAHNFTIGDVVALEFSDGAVIDTTVAAVFTDDSVVSSGVLVDESIVAAHARNIDATLGAIRFTESMPAADALAQVETAIAAFPQAESRTVEDFLANRQAQVDQLLLLANALLVLTVLIAMSGIANTVALSVLERTRESGLLRSVGMSRRQLRSMVRYEALITAVVGAILGTVVGIGLAAVTSVIVPDNFIAQLVVPGGAVAVYVVIAVLLGTLAALLPAWRASRLNVVTAMRG